MATPDANAITAEQLANLGNLVCERFCEPGHEEENRALLEAFECAGTVGGNLVSRALKEGFDDDRSGKCAHYIVKGRGIGYMFFSLRCGNLFDSQMAKDWYQNEKGKLDAKMQHAIDAGDIVQLNFLKKKLADLNEDKEEWKKDFLNANEDEFPRVKNSFGGIELVHFCKNDAAWDQWSTMEPSMGKPTRKMCEVLFWHFIVKRILDVVSLIGAEILYLFAADESEDQRLCSYYRGLGFKSADEYDVKCFKPKYDLNCIFMLCKVADLKSERDSYFSDFNRSPLDVA